jgi:hypothetical protein
MPRTIVKEVKNAVRYSDGTILIKDVRASYPHVGLPFKGKNDEGVTTSSYGIIGLMPKASSHKAAKALLDEVIAEICKDKKVRGVPAEKCFLRDGDASMKDDNENCFTISTRESNRPSVRDRRAQAVTDDKKAQQLVYGGCYVNMLIRPWWQDSKDYGKRINCGIVAVQFLRDGKPFGEGRVSEDDIDDTFEAYEDDEDAGFDDDGAGFDDDEDYGGL